MGWMEALQLLLFLFLFLFLYYTWLAVAGNGKTKMTDAVDGVERGRNGSLCVVTSIASVTGP